MWSEFLMGGGQRADAECGREGGGRVRAFWWGVGGCLVDWWV